MATVKKGITVETPEWWKHLRKFVHRRFWKRQRQADKKLAREDHPGHHKVYSGMPGGETWHLEHDR